MQASVAVAGGSALVTTLALFRTNSLFSQTPVALTSYGPLKPTNDLTTGQPLLMLPDGFTYRTYGWAGHIMNDGAPTPGLHDGMGVISSSPDELVLCRNHEVPFFGPPLTSDSRRTYDSQASGGCTNLVFSLKSSEFTNSYASIAGTLRNCAGGVTPWGTWLTCEEVVASPDETVENTHYKCGKPHGYIFEVPVEGVQSPQPLTDMGRFWHEAIAFDPKTGYVYETEDRKESGFYRFIPQTPEKLASGGKLQMMKLKGLPDSRTGITQGASFDVSWVDIAEPNQGHSPGTTDAKGVFEQGKKLKATTFARLEGCDYFDGRIVFVATNGGDAKSGQIWQYSPQEETVTLLYESPNRETLDFPDNVTFTPNGHIILCEDSDRRAQRLFMLNPQGEMAVFAVNNMNLKQTPIDGAPQRDFSTSEWAGACFSPDGKWLFVNIQDPGVTIAITGPWNHV